MSTFLAKHSTVWHLSGMRIRGIVVVPFLGVLGLLAAPALAQFSPGFQTFDAPDSYVWGTVRLSDDGEVVSGNVGDLNTSPVIAYGFTLTQSTYSRFQEPGLIYDISSAGAYSSLYNGRRASDGTIEVLDPSITTPTTGRLGSSISRDGRAIAASNQIQPSSGGSPESNRAYRWTEGFGVTVLPQYRPGAAFTEARDISGDGQVIVGRGRMSTFSDQEAWVWTEAGGSQFSRTRQAPLSSPIRQPRPTTTARLWSVSVSTLALGCAD